MKKINIRVIFPYLGLIFVLIFFGVGTAGKIYSTASLKALLNSWIYTLIASIGFVFVLAMGDVDFSIGMNMLASCAVAAYACRINLIFGLAAGVATGAVLELVNALIIVKLKVPSFISSLAMQYVCNGIGLVILNNGTVMGSSGISKYYTMPLRLALIFGFSIGGYFLFEKTAYGKRVKICGAAPEAAKQGGINVTAVRISAFVLMGAIMGLLGFVSLLRTGSATTTTGQSIMLDVLIAVLVGGLPFTGGTTSKFRAAIIGSIIITMISSGMTMMGMASIWQQVVKGMVFLVTVSLSFERKNLRVIK